MKLDSPARKTTAVIASVLLIGLAAYLIHLQRQPTKDPYPHHRMLGRVMAEELVKSLEHRDKKRLLLITAKSPDPMLAMQVESFLKTLKQHPEIEIKDTVALESDGKQRIGMGHGLSARRFVRLVEKNLKADAIVSFVGVPDVADPDMKELKVKVPRFLAETVAHERVQPLIDQKMLRVAILPRYEFPAPVKEPKSDRQWFDKYFQVLHAPKSTNTVSETTTDAGPVK